VLPSRKAQSTWNSAMSSSFHFISNSFLTDDLIIRHHTIRCDQQMIALINNEQKSKQYLEAGAWEEYLGSLYLADRDNSMIRKHGILRSFIICTFKKYVDIIIKSKKGTIGGKEYVART
jgi:hypothetical protein